MSLKKEIIKNFIFLPDLDALKNNKIVLATALGLVSGRLPSDEEVENKESLNAALVKICSDTANEYKSNLSLSETDNLPDNDGYIYLVDVEIKSSNAVFKTPFMVVFYDQIIGVSIGNI